MTTVGEVARVGAARLDASHGSDLGVEVRVGSGDVVLRAGHKRRCSVWEAALTPNARVSGLGLRVTLRSSLHRTTEI